LFFFLDCWSLIYCEIIMLILHAQCTDCTPFVFWIFHTIRMVLGIMRREFLAYLTKMLCLYHSNILNFVFPIPTIVFCMSLYLAEGTPYICICQRMILNGPLHHFDIFLNSSTIIRSSVNSWGITIIIGFVSLCFLQGIFMRCDFMHLEKWYYFVK